MTAKLCDTQGLSDWRQSNYNIRHTKRMMRTAQNKKRARGRTEGQKEKCEAAVVKAHQEYITMAHHYLNKAELTFKFLEGRGTLSLSEIALVKEARNFIQHGFRQINHIERRVVRGEVIPPDEKVLSLFEPHTEWIVKGKAGVPVELGVKVCIAEDQHQFILHHKVMQKQTDAEVAIPIVDETKAHYSNFSTCSFDKGFHSVRNQEVLSEKLETVALKRKGKLSQKDEQSGSLNYL